ncbi:MAG: hypothetical protein GY850_36155, partial [bacterium]|nr:hypothetical protein [bacterium]
MKKIMTGIAITALLIGAGIFFVIKTYSKTIILTPEMIQARLDEKFPVSKKKYFTNFVITDPEVLLEEGSDRIGLGISVNITTPEIIIDKK